MHIATDLVDMRLFIHVVDGASMTAGARRSHLSLQAASARIRLLEQRLGIALLYRQNQGVSATPAGQAYARHARLVMAQMERLQGDLQDFVNGVKGDLRLFASATALSGYLPDSLAPFMLRHPHVNVQLHERLTIDIARALREGQTDIGIVCGKLVSTEGLEVRPYRRDRWMVAVARGHALADAACGVDFVQTLAFEHVTLGESSAVCVHMGNVASQLNRVLRVRVHLSDFDAACRMATAGVGVCVLPESAALRYRERLGFELVALRDDWALRDMRICARAFDQLPSFGQALVALLAPDGGELPAPTPATPG